MKLVRQGDILFTQVGWIPQGARLLPDGIVARGEVTGHAHRIAELESAELYEIDGLYLRVTSDQGVSIVHNEHRPVLLEKGNWKVIRQREYSPEEIRNVAD